MEKRIQTALGVLAACLIAGCVVDDEHAALSGAKPVSNAPRKAPDFIVTGLDGKTVQLSSLKGKVVYLDFWGTECPPCKKGLPFTQRLDETFKNKGLAVLAISTEGKDAVAHFLTRNHMAFPAYLDDGPAVQAFNVDAIPHTVILDKDGNVVSDDEGLAPQADTIANLKKAGLDVTGFHPENDPMTSEASSGSAGA